MTDFGRMDSFITLQRRVTVTDPIGGTTTTWQDIATRVPCNVENVEAEERIEASQLVGKNRMRFIIRWSPRVAGIGSGDGLTWEGREFNALEVFYIPPGRPEKIELVAEARTD
jgi:SPP1 family predicted phage head-tail adaptor